MNEIKDHDIKSMADLIENQQLPREPDGGGMPFVLLREDQRVEDVEKLSLFPSRKKGTASFTRSESFNRFVNAYKDEDSRIYASGRSVVAILNHFSAKSPDWGDFRAAYNFPESAQWALWSGSNGKKFNQKQFGQLIEDNLADIVSPTSADLLDMVRQFEATSSVEYKSFDRGDNGNFSVSFVQTTQSKAGQKGQVELPRSFTLHIPAFDGGEAHPLVAKLRFDISGGQLCLWYELQQVQAAIDRHIESVLADIESSTGIKPFYGTPAK